MVICTYVCILKYPVHRGVECLFSFMFMFMVTCILEVHGAQQVFSGLIISNTLKIHFGIVYKKVLEEDGN